MRFVAIFLVLMVSLAQAAPPKKVKDKTTEKPKSGLTKKMLLKKAPVPERRKFPPSRRSSPCDDFHHYVCSEAEYKFKLPSHKERWVFSFADNEERITYAKRQFFNRISSYKPPSERENQFKDFYISCLNNSGAAREGRELVTEEKKRLAKITSAEGLASHSTSHMLIGDLSLSHFEILPNKDNPLKRDVNVWSGGTYLPERSYYENKDLVLELKKRLESFFKEVGLDKPEERAQWVIDYETAYAKATPLPGEIRQRATERREISRESFLAKYPQLKLASFFEKLPADTTILDLIPESNAFVNKALVEMPLDQLKSVYLFHYAYRFFDESYPHLFKTFFLFQANFLGGPKSRRSRPERCASMTSDLFSMEVDNQLIEILFPDFPQERVEKMTETLRAAIVKGLEESTWMSNSTRKEAVNKIKSAKLFLVKPRAEEDWDYKTIKKYSTSKYFANLSLYHQTETERKFERLSQARNPNLWFASPLTVNAFYIAADNKFILPMGILQFPFFDAEGSDISNFAAIGSIIGHELGHAIDDQGSKFDENGKVRKWFSNRDLKRFQERTSKFVKQFNKIGYDGYLTLGENIGDQVGLSFAYAAAAPANVEEKKNFFISYARTWCTVSTPAMQQRLLKTDPHAWPIERVNQQVIHQDGFYEAFRCEESDKMYLPPADRIKVW